MFSSPNRPNVSSGARSWGDEMEKELVNFRKESQKTSLLAEFAKSSYNLVRSELRVTIFVWATLVSYLIASHLAPDYGTLGLLAVSSYFLVLGVYVLNDITDMSVDAINSPKRPLASGAASKSHAMALSVFSIIIALLLSALINVPTLAIYMFCLFLGLSYSVPRIHAKKTFLFKAIVPSSGAALISMAGGMAAQSLEPTIFFAAMAFALFALVTLLLGDISDIKGDIASGVRSFPVVIGPRNAILFAMAIPLLLAGLGVVLFRVADLNLVFVFLLIGLSAYCTITMRSLISNYDDPILCRKVKSRMRIVHFLIQLTFVLGILSL